MSQPSGRILLVANGAPPGRRIWAALAAGASQICCVDGGANTVRRLGVMPAAVFGDFDSVSPLTRGALAAAEWVPAPDQEFTDLDKALGCLEERGATDVSIVGGLGRRVDHSLSNLSLLLKYRGRLSITFHTSIEDVFLLEGRWSFEARRGRRISVIPLFGRARVTLSGLQYPLEDEPLEMGKRESISNAASGGLASVLVSEGPVLVCVGRTAREAPAFAPGGRA
jgi:thiamine pyrophosphokinase